MTSVCLTFFHNIRHTLVAGTMQHILHQEELIYFCFWSSLVATHESCFDWVGLRTSDILMACAENVHDEIRVWNYWSFNNVSPGRSSKKGKKLKKGVQVCTSIWQFFHPIAKGNRKCFVRVQQHICNNNKNQILLLNFAT